MLVPEAVDPADLVNKAFAFEDGDAFGVSGEVTLSFNTFTEEQGRLRSRLMAGQRAAI